MEAIVGGCVAVLLVAMLKLMQDHSELRGEFRTMKEYWMRTAERRDRLVQEIERRDAKDRADLDERLKRAELSGSSGRQSN